ncbi:MAG TPA: hypothetical protein VM305_08325 [Candidatus Limnocylindrales bacterium]|nr:hypothetical protein [Candidatus Limnocylindrales bacterium]
MSAGCTFWLSYDERGGERCGRKVVARYERRTPVDGVVFFAALCRRHDTAAAHKQAERDGLIRKPVDAVITTHTARQATA